VSVARLVDRGVALITKNDLVFEINHFIVLAHVTVDVLINVVLLQPNKFPIVLCRDLFILIDQTIMTSLRWSTNSLIDCIFGDLIVNSDKWREPTF